MMRRQLFVVLATASSLALAACGGGSNTVISGGGTSPVVGPGALTVTPASLSFSGPGAPSQTFTINSTVGGVPAPTVNLSGCSPVASIGTASTSLPAVYTVTPTANGNCTFSASLGSASVAIGITVGPTTSPTINSSTNTIALVVGGTAGSVSVTASSGTFSVDTTACNGIATVTTTSSGVGSASYSVAPVNVGSCQFPIVNGSTSLMVAVVVNTPPSGPGALQLSTSTMTFTFAAGAPGQQGTVSFTGSVGQVSINEADCIGQTGKPKIAFLTLNNTPPGTPISLPASFTVTEYGPASGGTGTCTIRFIPQNGTEADLSVTVQ